MNIVDKTRFYLSFHSFILFTFFVRLNINPHIIIRRSLSLSLPPQLANKANPRSSIGRRRQLLVGNSFHRRWLLFHRSLSLFHLTNILYAFYLFLRFDDLSTIVSVAIRSLSDFISPCLFLFLILLLCSVYDAPISLVCI